MEGDCESNKADGPTESMEIVTKDGVRETNYLVMSDAGKIIFANYGNDASLCAISGLIQTLRATTLGDPQLGHSDLQCIDTDSSLIVFHSIGAVTLVAIAYKDRDGICETIDYLMVQLEVIYSAIVFDLTDDFQYRLQQQPHLDISYLLGSTIDKLSSMTSEMNLNAKKCCWMGGVDVISPIPSEVRRYTSKVLASECSKNTSIIYGILSVNKSIFNIVQPHKTEHQLNTFDLNTLLHFFDSQTLLQGNELWFPICLPHLNQSGYVYCYQCCIGLESKERQRRASSNAKNNLMRLTLISQEPSLDEFNSLKRTANDIRHKFGIPIDQEEVLRIYNVENNTDALSGDDSLIWERNTIEGMNEENSNAAEQNDLDIFKKRFRSHWAYHTRKALDIKLKEERWQDYCLMSSMIHFMIQIKVPIRHSENGSDSGGYLSQLFGPSIPQDGILISGKKIWNMYQQLYMNYFQAVDSPNAYLEKRNDMKNYASSMDNQSINQFRLSQMMHCNEKDRSKENKFFDFIVDHDHLFIIHSKPLEYVFFAVLPGDISSVSDAKVLSATLIETLMSKGDALETYSFL